jgi:hypothetical protein
VARGCRPTPGSRRRAPRGGGGCCTQQLVAFRASAVLLILTLGELSVVFGAWHADDSPFVGRGLLMILGGIAVFLVGVWQMVITRFIDNYIVNPPVN